MTKTQLIKKVLQKLRVLEVGEAVDADQTTTVGDIYDKVYQVLKKKELVTWTADGEIPDLQGIDVAIIVASNCVDEFMIPEQRALRLMSEAASSMVELQIAVHVPYVSTEEPRYY